MGIRPVKKKIALVSCTLCHANVPPDDKVQHLVDKHDSRNHCSQVIGPKEVNSYFREPLPPPKPQSITITTEEHAICMRFKKVEQDATKHKWGEDMDWYHFTIAYFMGAGLTRRRASQFALLCYSSSWLKNPIFAKAV